MRHHDARNIIYRYAKRGDLNAELEKAGILDEPGVIVSLSRAADVLVDGLASRASMPGRVALDIKVINALGPSHFNLTLGGPLAAASTYRDHAIAHKDTGARCAARGIRYEPLVFTTQGGCEGHAEAIIAQIADAIAKCEDRSSGDIKAEILQKLLLSIARSVARAVARRKKRRWTPFCHLAGRLAAEFATLREPDDE